MVLIQDPEEAEFPTMPKAAIQATPAEHVLTVKEIAAKLRELK
jgi:chemotaxis response regulator CheB